MSQQIAFDKMQTAHTCLSKKTAQLPSLGPRSRCHPYRKCNGVWLMRPALHTSASISSCCVPELLCCYQAPLPCTAGICAEDCKCDSNAIGHALPCRLPALHHKMKLLSGPFLIGAHTKTQPRRFCCPIAAEASSRSDAPSVSYTWRSEPGASVADDRTQFLSSSAPAPPQRAQQSDSLSSARQQWQGDGAVNDEAHRDAQYSNTSASHQVVNALHTLLQRAVRCLHKYCHHNFWL